LISKEYFIDAPQAAFYRSPIALIAPTDGAEE
jgi:hypothetical protein